MPSLRFQALKALKNRKVITVDIPNKLSKMYAASVFTEEVMQSYLTQRAFDALSNAIYNGQKVSREIADQVATSMKEWALSKGATHYTHWFQPLTGATAEKHDAFFNPLSPSRAIEKFNGGMLIQQEPDASSFPNGGIRNTFEARGYTAWDPSSSAFIMGSTLCIPTIFVSYTGEALDHKTPLLRSIQVLDAAATRVIHYFDKHVEKVISTLGWEQEYFLIDADWVAARPDLLLTGRTLIGHAPAKGQQLEDHYFGTIPTRVMHFMQELEVVCLQLGIPVKTRHNEVAPRQFELAPVFEEANLAVDHNALLMDLMERVAQKHHFKVLLHEKPFAGVNGSGKHNNWSLATQKGVNLLSPGKTPKKNLQFLTFFINTIKAVHDYADLLRAAIASAGNDHRLGANEAPPAIISIFIGTHLNRVLNEIEKISDGALSPDEKTDLKLNLIGKIPEILLDNTDRNRTSPFAFTGNKFEFRAVGSSANCSEAIMVLNTIVAHQLNLFYTDTEELISKGMKKDDAILNTLRNYIKQSKKIRFEGDGYSKSWEEMALERGLSNLKNTPEALQVETQKQYITLFESLGIMSEREILARNEIKMHKYARLLEIEAHVLVDLSRNQIIPTALNYQNKLIENVKGLKELFENEYKTLSKETLSLIKDISKHVNQIKLLSDLLEQEKEKASSLNSAKKQAFAFCEQVKPLFEKLRAHCDALEMKVEDALWPLPKYSEMLLHK